jgi:hypothetical protein
MRKNCAIKETVTSDEFFRSNHFIFIVSSLAPSKLSRLQRWILLTAYRGILEAGSNEPTKRDAHYGYYGRVHLLRIEVLRDYFNMPIRAQRKGYGGQYLVIDMSKTDPEKANAPRTALTRSLRRLKTRGLISGSITLTAKGIAAAKELTTAM